MIFNEILKLAIEQRLPEGATIRAGSGFNDDNPHIIMIEDHRVKNHINTTVHIYAPLASESGSRTLIWIDGFPVIRDYLDDESLQNPKSDPSEAINIIIKHLVKKGIINREPYEDNSSK